MTRDILASTAKTAFVTTATPMVSVLGLHIEATRFALASLVSRESPVQQSPALIIAPVTANASEPMSVSVKQAGAVCIARSCLYSPN